MCYLEDCFRERYAKQLCKYHYQKDFYRKNPEYGRAKSRKWKAANPEKVRELRLKWRRENPEEHILQQAKARAKWKAKRLGCFMDPSAQSFRFDDSCYYCGVEVDILAEQYADIKPNIDHPLSLCRGGHHSLDNMVTACRSCNYRKHKRTPLEWLLAQKGGLQG